MSGVDGPTVGGRRRRRRIRTLAMAGAAAMVLAVMATAAVGLGTDGSEQPAPDPRASFKTIPVTRGDLVEYVVLDGEVGYGTPVPVRCEATGITTWIASRDTVVRRGKGLMRVDEQPIVLLYGPLPMYRPLAAHVTGPDVEQFERNLRKLGYTGFTVDDTYSPATVAAVKRWQRDLGWEETGRIEVGQVVYAPGEVRIADHLVRVGAAVPAEVLTTTGTTRVVTIDVAQAASAWATAGAKVTVTLPDGRTVPGTVYKAGDEGALAGPAGEAAQSTGGGSATRVSVTVTVADQKALQAVDAGTVEVRRVSRERKNVLTVPVSALLALAEGGYGVEVVDEASTRIVAVEAGMFADGRVEVSGDGIDAGMTVRIPQ